MKTKAKNGFSAKVFLYCIRAFIMLVGLCAGALLCPPPIAQREDVLGDIKCTSLTVVDMSGEPAIVLRTDEALGNGGVIHNPAGEPAMLLGTSELANRVSVHNQDGIIRWEAP